MTTETYDPNNDEHVMQLARWLEEAKFSGSRAEAAIEVIVNTVERNAMFQAMDSKPEDIRYVQGLRMGALGVLAHLDKIRKRSAEIVNAPPPAPDVEEKVRQMALGGGTTL